MVDMAFLRTYKGVLYPLPLHLESHQTDTILERPLRSLVDLSAEKITQDSTSTNRALEAIPVELCYSLMRAALRNQRDRAIEVLIARWPYAILRLSKLAPLLFEELGALYDDRYITERMRRGVKYTTCLAHTFVECLKKRAPTKLKYLDLAGYPSAEVIVNYLSSHVLLVYNEARQREIITMYNEVTRNLPDEQRQTYNIDTTLPDTSFVINLDAFVQSNDTHMELCRALKTSKLEQCRFKLRVHRLDLTCLGVARISVLLEQVDPQHLNGLCLQYNNLCNDGLAILVPAIQRLTHITSLDLSCNNLTLYNNEEAASHLAHMFSMLPCLTRLDLSNNRIQHKLRRLLSGIQQPLEYLAVCACRLVDKDLHYLQTSHHISQLKELDLSENNLGRNFHLLLPLLNLLSHNILVLELEDCEFQGTDLFQLLQMGPKLQRLKFLNICRNSQLVQDIILGNVFSVASASSLEVLKLSYPVEVYSVGIEEDDIDSEKAVFQSKMKTLLSSLCDKKGRPHIMLDFVT